MIKEVVYDKILYNTTIKNTVIYLLRSKFLMNNRVYRFLHNRRIQKIIDKYKNAPHCVKIENTNACNARCIMCTHDKMKRKVGFMDWNLFKKIVDEASELGVEHISLHNFGEPLLDKNFPKKVKYAKDKGIPRVSTNTNASTLTEEMSYGIIESGLDDLFISLDGATKETFEKIRVGLNYNVVEANVRNLAKIKKELGSKKPVIVVDFVQFDKNIHETNMFKDKWKGIVDRVCISSLHNWGGGLETKGQGGIHETYVANDGIPCRLLFTDLVVNWDGTVPLCCQDVENEIVLGDIKESKIEDVWKGEKFNSMRKKHLTNRISDISMCKNCKLHTFWWMF